MNRKRADKATRDPGKKQTLRHIAVFPILADVVEVKTGSWSTDHWSNDFIRLNGWLRTCFAQLITPLDIDGIGQNWEESNTLARSTTTYVQPFSPKSRTRTVPKEFEIGLCWVVEADLDLFCDSWSEGFFGERLYSSCRQAVFPRAAGRHHGSNLVD